MRIPTLAWTMCLGMTLVSSTASAIPARVSQVPNGGEFSCNLCHTNGGATPRNAFGLQVESTLVGEDVDWAAIFDLDADDDGFTNGQEMGDPDGDGTPEAGAEVTDPADADDFPGAGGTGTGDTGTGGTDGNTDGTTDGTTDGATDGTTDTTDGTTDDNGSGCTVAPAPSSLPLAALGGLLLLGLRRRD